MSQADSVATVLIAHIPENHFMPLYQKVYEAVKKCIEEEIFLPGQLLPSVRDLTDLLSVSPMTVSKAYQLLKRDGLVESEASGRGTRIAEAPAIDNLITGLVVAAKARKVELKELLAMVKKQYS
jgi:GntR family transcriptional regulator